MATLTEANAKAPKSELLKASQFAAMGIPFCIASAQETVSTFRDKQQAQIELSVCYLYNGSPRRQKIWLSADETRRSIFFNPDPGKRIDLPYHNAALVADGTYLKLMDAAAPAQPCACSRSNGNGNGHGHKEESADDILKDYGFESPPATDAEKEAIVILSAALPRPIPANLDTMTSEEARIWLQQAKRQHAGI